MFRNIEIHILNFLIYQINKNEILNDKYINYAFKFLDKENKKSAAFCPIMGVDSSVGMIVVLYNDSITQNSIDNLKRKIGPVLQPLAVLLDYDYKIEENE